MGKRNQNYSKHEPMKKDVVDNITGVIEETDSVQDENKGNYLIKIETDLWLKTLYPYVTTDIRADALILPYNRAIDYSVQVKARRRVKVSLVKS